MSILLLPGRACRRNIKNVNFHFATFSVGAAIMFLYVGACCDLPAQGYHNNITEQSKEKLKMQVVEIGSNLGVSIGTSLLPVHILLCGHVAAVTVACE